MVKPHFLLENLSISLRSQLPVYWINYVKYNLQYHIWDKCITYLFMFPNIFSHRSAWYNIHQKSVMPSQMSESLGVPPGCQGAKGKLKRLYSLQKIDFHYWKTTINATLFEDLWGVSHLGQAKLLDCDKFTAML